MSAQWFPVFHFLAGTVMVKGRLRLHSTPAQLASPLPETSLNPWLRLCPCFCSSTWTEWHLHESFREISSNIEMWRITWNQAFQLLDVEQLLVICRYLTNHQRPQRLTAATSYLFSLMALGSFGTPVVFLTWYFPCSYREVAGWGRANVEASFHTCLVPELGWQGGPGAASLSPWPLHSSHSHQGGLRAPGRMFQGSGSCQYLRYYSGNWPCIMYTIFYWP